MEEARRIVNRANMNIGGLAEAMLSRFFVESLERAGFHISGGRA